MSRKTLIFYTINVWIMRRDFEGIENVLAKKEEITSNVFVTHERTTIFKDQQWSECFDYYLEHIC